MAVIARFWHSLVVLRGAVGTYALHQHLWRAFDRGAARGPAARDDDEGAPRPFVFRAEESLGDDDLRVRETRVLVVSKPFASPPAWSALGAVLDADQSRCVARELPLEAGQRLRFLLRANPTRRTQRAAGYELGDLAQRERYRQERGNAKARGPRVAVFGEEAREAWLVRKGEAAGFALARDEGGAALLRQQRACAVFWGKRGAEAARHDGVDFEGVLEVREPERLAAALVDGVGTARALGFGLLSVRAP